MAENDGQKGRRREGASRGRRGGRGRSRPRPGGGAPAGRGRRRPNRAAIISLDSQPALGWAERIEAHLGEKFGTVFRLSAGPEGSLGDLVKEARRRGAHRVLAVGDDRFVSRTAHAMVGSLMPLAPALVPGTRGIFGHHPLSGGRWREEVEQLFAERFIKVDIAVGSPQPFLHQLVAGFPARRPDRWPSLRTAFKPETVHFEIEIDRAQLAGDFWCVVVANADFPGQEARWVPGSSWTDQCLDLIAVRPRSLLGRMKFLRAARRGLHGGLPGVVRFRGQRITLRGKRPFRFATDGGSLQDAPRALVLEAKSEQLRLVHPEQRTKR